MCGYFGGVYADGLYNGAAICNDGLEGGFGIKYHNVYQYTGCCGLSAERPGAAYFGYGIVKRYAAVAAFADGPAEDLLVEGCRCFGIGSGYFEVADLAVAVGGLFVAHDYRDLTTQLDLPGHVETNKMFV